MDDRPNRRNKAAFSNVSALDFYLGSTQSLTPPTKKNKKKITLNFTMQLLFVVHLIAFL